VESAEETSRRRKTEWETAIRLLKGKNNDSDSRKTNDVSVGKDVNAEKEGGKKGGRSNAARTQEGELALDGDAKGVLTLIRCIFTRCSAAGKKRGHYQEEGGTCSSKGESTDEKECHLGSFIVHDRRCANECVEPWGNGEIPRERVAGNKAQFGDREVGPGLETPLLSGTGIGMQEGKRVWVLFPAVQLSDIN